MLSTLLLVSILVVGEHPLLLVLVKCKLACRSTQSAYFYAWLGPGLGCCFVFWVGPPGPAHKTQQQPTHFASVHVAGARAHLTLRDPRFLPIPMILDVTTMIGWLQVCVVALFVGLALPGQPKKQSNNPHISLMFMLLGPGPT